jgi:hypothetical protein
VKTALIEGKQPAEFDAILLHIVDLISDTPKSVWSESMLIGIRNEYGDIYRAIGVTGLSHFVHALERLHDLGCTHEIPETGAAEQGFDALVSPPWGLKDQAVKPYAGTARY